MPQKNNLGKSRQKLIVPGVKSLFNLKLCENLSSILSSYVKLCMIPFTRFKYSSLVSLRTNYEIELCIHIPRSTFFVSSGKIRFRSGYHISLPKSRLNLNSVERSKYYQLLKYYNFALSACTIQFSHHILSKYL